MTCRQITGKRFNVKIFGVNMRCFYRCGDNACVEFVIFEPFDDIIGKRLLKYEFNIGMLGEERMQKTWNKIRGNRWNHANPKRTAERCFLVLYNIRDAPGVLQNDTSLFQYFHTYFCGNHRRFRSVEQYNIQLVLKFMDLHA